MSTLLGSATSWDSGNILMGGAGDDTIEGGGGNDLIDGDATLRVQLDTPRWWPVASLSAIRADLLDGTLSPSLVDIVRTVVAGTPGATTWRSSPGTSPSTR